ncbi:MAG: lantibiotic immunity ABC transporter MutG family permease subunit [Clostridium cochlearium]|uniref:lantibiotic immunity ABC transporter MutG family permease subunit n=1 Tax=Clostridium cochlearium TaxID=1494 RepID=UPI00280C0A59|nr:lantibiotic immunity ABC transporter MutG family permease subunit [Clostridium cochlearium]MDU1444110.1 lantibiotic immunity ABC transporter MutG family permease subunit [Clostridium cochlearium]
MKILRLMKADFIKMKHTSFYWIHICMPVIGTFMFLWYYSFSILGSIGKVNGYLDALSLVFPVLIGIICSTVIEQEVMAGKFKEMLSIEYGKEICLLSKILVVLVMGFFSLSLAVGGFFIGFQYILKQNILPFKFYVILTLLIFVAQIFIYLFHLWLSIKFGSEASIGMGIFESLFSALIITGLGDGIWQWIPCAWSVRFCNNFFIKESNSIDVFNELADFNTGLSINAIGLRNCIIFTIVLGILFGIWFNFFEGRENE